MKIRPEGMAGVVALLLLPVRAFGGCMEDAPDRDALIQCSKYELVMPENRVGRAWKRLNELHAGDGAALAELREDKRRWDEGRDARCVAESRARAKSADGQPAPLEQERAMLVCLTREFTSRAEDLEGRLAAAGSPAAGSSAAAPAVPAAAPVR